MELKMVATLLKNHVLGLSNPPENVQYMSLYHKGLYKRVLSIKLNRDFNSTVYRQYAVKLQGEKTPILVMGSEYLFYHYS